MSLTLGRQSAITFWFKDVDFDGDKVWEYFHMNN